MFRTPWTPASKQVETWKSAQESGLFLRDGVSYLLLRDGASAIVLGHQS